MIIKDSWQNSIRDMLKELVNKYELPKNSLYLSENRGQKASDSIISYSICIWEPNYPPVANEVPGKNVIVVTIVPSTARSRPDDLDLLLREEQMNAINRRLPEDAEKLPQTKSDNATGSIRIRFKKGSNSLIDYLNEYTSHSIEHYVSKEDRFGCCSLFKKCSDARKCLHENKLYSKACIYRNNLEQGKIFYGNNPTV